MAVLSHFNEYGELDASYDFQHSLQVSILYKWANWLSTLSSSLSRTQTFHVISQGEEHTKFPHHGCVPSIYYYTTILYPLFPPLRSSTMP